MDNINKNIGTLIASVFFLSLVSIFGRLLFPISGYVNTFFGYLIVWVLTFLWLIFNKKLSTVKLRKKKKELFLLGIGQLGSAAFFLEAIQSVNLAIAGLLLYSAPIWIAIFYLITKEEKLSKKIIIPLSLGLIGVIILMGPENFAKPFEIKIGLIIGLLSGISYAMSYIFARRIKDEYNTTGIVFWNHLIGAIILLPLLFIFPFQFNAETMPWFIGIGLSWTFGYCLLYYSLKHVKAHFAAIIALSEPVFIALWGFAFFKEAIMPLTFAGGIILLINIYFVNEQIE